MLLAKLPSGHSIKAGTVLLPVELPKHQKTTHAIVMQPGSQGKQDGYDIMFGLCGEKCVSNLKKALEEEGTEYRQ